MHWRGGAHLRGSAGAADDGQSGAVTSAGLAARRAALGERAEGEMFRLGQARHAAGSGCGAWARSMPAKGRGSWAGVAGGLSLRMRAARRSQAGPHNGLCVHGRGREAA